MGQKRRQTKGKGIKRGDKMESNVAGRIKTKEKVEDKDGDLEKTEGQEFITSSRLKRGGRQEMFDENETKEVQCGGRMKK